MTYVYSYPFVECAAHPGPQKTVCCCKHVLGGAEISRFEEATDAESGLAICADCDNPEGMLENCICMCLPHYQEIMRRFTQ